MEIQKDTYLKIGLYLFKIGIENKLTDSVDLYDSSISFIICGCDFMNQSF